MQLHCKHCNAKIPTKDISPTQQLISCPACDAVFGVAGDFEARLVKSTPWPSKLSFGGLTIEASERKLSISRRWFDKSKHLMSGAMGLFLAGFVLISMVGSGHVLTAFIIPHTWIGLGMFYYALTGILNSTIIRVNSHELSIKHGPLPLGFNRQINAAILKQLYTKQKVHRNKNRTWYSYEIHMVTNNDKDKTIVKGISKAPQAVYLEQEIERFLSIPDQPIVGSVDWPKNKAAQIDWRAWQAFAQTHGFTFTPGVMIEGVRVSGRYQGFGFGMMAFHKDWESSGTPYTLIEMTISPAASAQQKLTITPTDVAKLFDSDGSKIKLKGIMEATEQGQKLTYVQHKLETDQYYLNQVLESLYTLIRVYPAIVALGGQIIPHLHPAATTENHPLQSVAQQLIKDIAATTHRLAYQLSKLVCRHCLLHFAEHKADISRFQIVTYYGCQQCHRSTDYFEVRHVVAVLDQQMTDRTAYDNGVLRINWIRHRHLFNFNAVEIITASDEDVERFAVQVGNDTNPVRKPQYKSMGCRVAASATLSPNTLRILQHTFGQIAIGEV